MGDVEDVDARNRTGVLIGMGLGVFEVSGDGDDSGVTWT